MNKIEVEWTGEYPCVCDGEWKIIYNGKDVSNVIPNKKRYSPMDTYKSYSYWSWNYPNSIEVWHEYFNGLEEEESKPLEL